MTAAASHQRVFAIPFRRLHRWSVGSFVHSGWHWAADLVKPLSAVLTRKVAEVDRADYEFDSLQLVTLHFDGEMEPRNLRGKDSFVGKLFFADAGDVLYSKIDVRNGAIGVVPPHLPRVAVSSEYPVYEVDEVNANAHYIRLLFRTQQFRRTINAMISGASGRKRVQPSELEAMSVPIPPRTVQDSIVAQHRKTQKLVADRHKLANEVVVKLDARFYNDLGLAALATHDLPKILAVPWTGLIRWGVNYNQYAQTAVDLTQGKYPVVDLGSVLTLVQYGTSVKANTAGKGTPIVRMNNIKDGRLNLGNLKHIELSAKQRSNLLLEHDDILINRTNSKELVGKCAVFHEDAEYVFASYLIRLRADPVQADPQFVSHALNSTLGRQQIDAVSRQIIGQANINTEEIRALQIPLPRVAAQRRIMERVQEGRAKADALRTEADELAAQATTEVEEMILGTRPVA